MKIFRLVLFAFLFTLLLIILSPKTPSPFSPLSSLPVPSLIPTSAAGLPAVEGTPLDPEAHQGSIGATPPPSIVYIGLMGDLGLGRMITRIARSQNDFSYSFSGLSSWLSQNDLNIANLESPVIKDCPTLSPTTFTFCGDSRFLPQLAHHKFFLTLANNHILNFGPSGLVETKQLLSDYQIPFVYSHSIPSDTNQPSVFTQKTINGITLGFLGYDLTGTHQFQKSDILSQVSHYAASSDWLIVSLHWGNEYLPRPESWRVDFARQLVDRGADIIHGHHPHVWQEPETYQDKLIFYSFGNFIFDQNWSYATSHSNIIRLTLTKDKIINQQTLPIEIQDNSRPVLL